MNRTPEFLWYVTGVLLPRLKKKIGCPPPPILIQEKQPSCTPTAAV